MPPITVAKLAEQVSAQGEALSGITEALASLTAAITQEASPAIAPETVVHTKGDMIEFVSEPKAPVAPKAVGEAFTVTMVRQTDKSRGGKLRFWLAGSDTNAGGSVYVGGADDLKADKLTLTVCEAGSGQATLRVDRAKSGRRRSSKGRQSWSGNFAFGEAHIGIYVNVPKDVGKDLPDEVGFTLDGLTA